MSKRQDWLQKPATGFIQFSIHVSTNAWSLVVQRYDLIDDDIIVCITILPSGLISGNEMISYTTIQWRYID